VTIDRPSSATPGQDLTIAVRVAPGAAIRSVRLRYRHLTQYEDYAAVEMTAGGDGVFTAYIPASFITNEWDVMYFVEVITADGRGRDYPDLDTETPYVIVPVRH
jgi:hypothetical protein